MNEKEKKEQETYFVRLVRYAKDHVERVEDQVGPLQPQFRDLMDKIGRWTDDPFPENRLAVEKAREVLSEATGHLYTNPRIYYPEWHERWWPEATNAANELALAVTRCDMRVSFIASAVRDSNLAWTSKVAVRHDLPPESEDSAPYDLDSPLGPEDFPEGVPDLPVYCLLCPGCRGQGYRGEHPVVIRS